MHSRLNKILLVIAAAVVCMNAAWLLFGEVGIAWQRYAVVAVAVFPVAAAAIYYDRFRGEPSLSAVLACAAFMVVFAASASLASYLLITVSGPRIDDILAEADAAIGFHWPSIMAFAADHPRISQILALAYASVMPQTVVLLLWLGVRDRLEDLYGLVLALAYGAVITLFLWTLFPSFGAFSVFTLPDDVASKLNLIAGFDYAHDLVEMLESGPGFISPGELRGIVAFPSYHTLQALVLIWFSRNTVLRWPMLILNSLVLLAIPVHGGHHLVDVVGGLLVTAAAIALARATIAAAKRRGPVSPRVAPARGLDAKDARCLSPQATLAD